MPDNGPPTVRLADDLINPTDTPDRKNEKLLQIVEVLMRQVEQIKDDRGAAFAQFQRAALLEEQVRQRTRDLEHTLDLLNDSNARLAEANRETEEARKNLANAIETVQEGFALFDANDVMVMCNSRFGMHMLDIHDSLRAGLSFESYVELVSQSRFLQLPDTEDPESWAIRRKRRHKDQHVIFNVRLIWDRWVQVSEHRTKDGGTVILQTDVTDIIRVERQERGKMLDDQARIIRATLDHINQGVCIFDSNLRLAGWNDRLGQLLAIPLPRFRMGSGFDTLLDRLRQDISFGNGMTADQLHAWARQSDSRPPLSFEVQRGSDLMLDVFAQEMPDRGFVISFTDISREREAVLAMARANETLEQRVLERTLDLEDALADAERANAARTRFVAAASHDLLQPLSAAKLFLASVSDDITAASTRSTLEKAENALVSVESILGALLDISKLESGLAAVDVTTVRLGPLLTQLTDEFAPLAARKGIRLSIRPSSAVVQSDPTYLRRILQNLIGNALRYTETGHVLVGARRRNGGIRLEVWDTGPGIAEDDQETVFKEFHRLNARASASEGMGLGLAIVDRACALLGHPLELRSTLHKGTAFFIGVQLASTRTVPQMPDLLDDEDRPILPADRIALLVENDAEVGRAMTLLMEKWGVTVLDVTSGEEALALVDEIGIVPDIYLIDQQLGDGMTGLETLTALKDAYGPRPARIITANRSADLRADCAAAGVPMMYKPIDAAALGAFLNGATQT